MKKLLPIVFCLLLACTKAPEQPQPKSNPDPDTTPTVVAVSSVSISPVELAMTVGTKATLVASVKPENASNKTVSWSSSAPSVATVTSGTVTAVGVGEAIIYAQAGEAKAQCAVSVSAVSDGIQFAPLPSDNPLINGAGGTLHLSFVAADAWTVTTDANWLECEPSSGAAGENAITLTSSRNASGALRKGVLTFSQSDGNFQFEVPQRPYVFTRKKVASGTITNAVKLTYNNTSWNRIYAILPVPDSSPYQEISNLSTGDATIYTSTNTPNRYAVADWTGSFPTSGGTVISEQFDIDAYEVYADIGKMTDIPAYDPESEPCKRYLGAEAGDLIDPANTDIVTIASQLWESTDGDLLKYARKCYDWTAKNITYGNMNTGLHTITELMRTRKGDCGNFSSVFISLLRAKGIPARHVVMISPTEAGYHVRAEFYIPAYGWIPADPTFENGDPGGAYFGRFTGAYVVMSLGVNSACRSYDGKTFTADLLQAYLLWFWYSREGSYSFTHQFSNFR